MYTEKRYNDINGDFPSGQKKGASSAIVPGNCDWELFEMKNCEGGPSTAHLLKRKGEYPSFVDMKINDKIQSLQKK